MCKGPFKLWKWISNDWKWNASSLASNKVNCNWILGFNVRKGFRILNFNFCFDCCNLHLKFWTLLEDLVAIVCVIHYVFFHCLFFLNPNSYQFKLWISWSGLSLDSCVYYAKFKILVHCPLHVVTYKFHQFFMGDKVATYESPRKLLGFYKIIVIRVTFQDSWNSLFALPSIEHQTLSWTSTFLCVFCDQEVII